MPEINVAFIRSLFEAHVNREILEGYRLPISNPECHIVVGLSGGADSTVLAIFVAVYLAPLYPNIHFLFTDTKAEPESCYSTLDKVEGITGFVIDRIVPEHGLFELINEYNGFLPSIKKRWCTARLKIEPLKQYMKGLNHSGEFIHLAGIRADEPSRDGISFSYELENSKAGFPFIDLGITKTMVFDILRQSTGIPSTYQYRNRSGCSFSIFSAYKNLSARCVTTPARTPKLSP